MTQNIKPYGPLKAEDIQAMRDAPAGEAVKIIRKYDPAWGYGGENQKFLIKFERVLVETTYEKAEVEIAASSKEQAEKLAEEHKEDDLDWSTEGYGDEEYQDFGFEVIGED